MRTVALFGFGPKTRDLIHQVPHDTEIWSVNWAYKYDPPRIDRLFEIHIKEYLTSDWVIDLDDHWKWLQEEHDFPIYMTEKFDEVPNAIAYPVDELSDDLFEHLIRGPLDFSDDYWVSGMSYAFGMAIYEQVDRIELYGVEMVGGTDVAYQRDGIALLTGIAMGRGIDVWRPEITTFLRAKRYGFEATQMVSRASLEAHLEFYELDLDLIQSKLNRVNGIKEDRLRALEEETDEERIPKLESLYREAKEKYDRKFEAMQMTTGAVQAIKHLIATADLKEPDLKLEPAISVVRSEKV
jgi:hypothetical protein